MKIIVCIKQVPDTTEIKINPETNTLVREGVPSIINPFDMYAIEEGLRLKEKHGGSVVVMTMGPPQAVEALKEAISLGADEVVLVSDRAFAGSDTLATGYTLSKAIEKVGEADLVICGKQALDGDTGQVGPGIAEILDVPFVPYVSRIESVEEGKMTARSMTDSGYDLIESPLPACITVVKEINEPRLPSLRGRMRAKKTEPTVFTAEDLAADGRLEDLHPSTPRRRRNDRV
jgi:electron transfer flavoprotein beta subunit